MSETFVAKQALFVDGVRAANPGDVIDAQTVSNNGWEDGVARQGTKAAEKAVEDAAS